ncbi:MAG: DUF177 domain-containing protein [Oscillospiraceae bacterium]|jgi:uncharacterized metal-binding protein YceD (DUF177 family)|nr:DUF177 domain-containing protein [Oscillospiraceae bacterium]
MALDIRKILDSLGSIPFETNLDWVPSDVIGVIAWSRAPFAKGSVTHKASGFLLLAALTVSGKFLCDRCGAEFSQCGEIPIRAALTDELEDTDNPDYYLISGGELDVSEILRSEYVLQEPTITLCPTCVA